MPVRAVILDVYRTLLWISELRVPAPEAWRRLWEKQTGGPPPMPCHDYIRAWDDAVLAEHQRARSAGVDFPEVDGPSLVRSFLPRGRNYPRPVLERVLLAIAREMRDARLADGAADFLRELRSRGLLLGIASNSQPYTLAEFGGALRGEGLDLSIFEPDLVFWSHQHGVAKPSPFVFRTLSARLAARDITPAEAIMIGDRADRDTEPAAAQGWQTFLIDPAGPAAGWRLLLKLLPSAARQHPAECAASAQEVR